MKNLSDEEKEHLLSDIHRFLVWVGEPLPNNIEINGDYLNLRKLIWNCLHKKNIQEDERQRYEHLIDSLEKKEKFDEETLKKVNLTEEEAKSLYHEIASIIRAIMDLRECEEGTFKFRSEEEKKVKIEDTKKWLAFLKDIGK